MDLPSFVLQTVNLTANILFILALGYYFLKIHAKEKRLERKEHKIDSDYHHIVDTALSKERKILEDATLEANQLITGAQYISKNTKDSVDQALVKMAQDIQKEAFDTGIDLKNISSTSKANMSEALVTMEGNLKKEADAATQEFITQYTTSLQQFSTQSLTEFHDVVKGLESDLRKQTSDIQNVVKGLEVDVQKQIATFHETLLPNLQKELDAYKQNRINETDQLITKIILKASQEILNKSISLEDHQDLVIASLEKAKKEGVFN